MLDELEDNANSIKNDIKNKENENIQLDLQSNMLKNSLNESTIKNKDILKDYQNTTKILEVLIIELKNNLKIKVK